MIGALALVGALIERPRGEGSHMGQLAWTAKLAVVGAVGFAGVGMVLPVGQSYAPEDPEYLPLAIVLGVSFYGAATAFSLAIGLLVFLLRGSNLPGASRRSPR